MCPAALGGVPKKNNSSNIIVIDMSMNSVKIRAHFERHGISVTRSDSGCVWLKGANLLPSEQGPFPSVTAAHKFVFGW